MIKELTQLGIYLFAILGVLFLGYVLAEGMAYHVLAVFGLLVGLGLYWKLK